MSFFSKLVKGVGKVVGGIGKVATGLVSKLNIPIVSGAAGIANSLLSGSGSNPPQTLTFNQPIAPPPQTAAQAATFGGSVNVGGVSGTIGNNSWFTSKTDFLGISWYNWVLFIAAPALILFPILYLIFKRRRR